MKVGLGPKSKEVRASSSKFGWCDHRGRHDGREEFRGKQSRSAFQPRGPGLERQVGG